MEYIWFLYTFFFRACSDISCTSIIIGAQAIRGILSYCKTSLNKSIITVCFNYLQVDRSINLHLHFINIFNNKSVMINYVQGRFCVNLSILCPSSSFAPLNIALLASSKDTVKSRSLLVIDFASSI